MKKNHIIEVRLTEEEKKKIESKARAVGLAPSTFLRVLGLKSKVEIS